MTRAELIKEIQALDPEAKGLSKMKKADLQTALDGLQPAASPPGEHDWRLMFDGPDANEHWKGPDSPRWCG